MYHIIVDSLGPETILKIQFPEAEFHHGFPDNPVLEPAFDLLSENPIRVYEDITRTVEITPIDIDIQKIDDLTKITITLDTSDESIDPYIQVKLDYAVENDDGWVNTYDVDYLVEDVLGTAYGDADLNLVTDVRDFNKWNASKFTSGTDWSRGDFDGNGITDVRDFNLWNTNKFTAAPEPGALMEGQVPEPASLVLLAVAALAMATYALCRRST